MTDCEDFSNNMHLCAKRHVLRSPKRSILTLFIYTTVKAILHCQLWIIGVL